MCDPFHHSICGTGLPPPERHRSVTTVPSLKGPMRETFLTAADVLPSSSRISTYSGAAKQQTKKHVTLCHINTAIVTTT